MGETKNLASEASRAIVWERERVTPTSPPSQSFPRLSSLANFFFFSSCFFFLLLHSVLAFAHTVVAPGRDFFTNFFFLNEIPLKMCQVFERSVSDNIHLSY